MKKGLIQAVKKRYLWNLGGISFCLLPFNNFDLFIANPVFVDRYQGKGDKKKQQDDIGKSYIPALLHGSAEIPGQSYRDFLNSGKYQKQSHTCQVKYKMYHCNANCCFIVEKGRQKGCYRCSQICPYDIRETIS